MAAMSTAAVTAAVPRVAKPAVVIAVMGSSIPPASGAPTAVAVTVALDVGVVAR